MPASPEEVQRLLVSEGPFAGLQPPDLKELEGELEMLELAAGDTLLRRGDPGDDLFLVVAGQLEVLAPAGGEERRVGLLGPGTWLGELAAIAGGERTATVRALEACELRRITRAALFRTLDEHPQALARFLGDVRERLRRVRFRAIARELFEKPHEEFLAELEEQVEWLSLHAGERLFGQGDAAESAYLVLSGRLRVVEEGAIEERVLNDVGPGEMLGEMSLLTRDVRSASIYAVRDSQLARLSAATFERLIERHPPAMRRIAGLIVQRLRRREAEHPQRGLGSIAVVCTGRRPESRAVARRLTEALSRHGRALHLDRQRVETELCQPGVTELPSQHPASTRLEHWLDEREATHDYVVYEADEDWSGWTERATQLADHVMIVAEFETNPAPGELEARLRRRWQRLRRPETSFVLMHRDATVPEGTARWMEDRDVDQHFHVREGHPGDVDRIARTLTGHGVALVLGGGGARGFAHIGVLRALHENGVPVDVIGGTSIGAVIAATYALGWSWEEILEQCRRHFARIIDVTLPVVSLLAGRRIVSALVAGFGERDIEDLPLPYFCVSANISRALEEVHLRGSLVRAIRASISLPGVLPPVHAGGDLLVDGGLVNNLPVDVIARLAGGDRVVAVDVSPDTDLRIGGDLALHSSGWWLLWQRLNPFSRKLEVPHIASLLMRSSVIPSIIAARERKLRARRGLYLHVPTERWHMMEFESLDPIYAAGYESTVEAIGEWWSEAQRTVPRPPAGDRR